MKVFMDTDYDAYLWDIKPPEGMELDERAKPYAIYDVPKKLLRSYARLLESLDRLNQELDEIAEAGGETNPWREQWIARTRAARPQPRISVYQLRHVKSGLLLYELSTPEGVSFAHSFERGREPDGVCQWWAQHPDDDRFREHGPPFTYTPDGCVAA